MSRNACVIVWLEKRDSEGYCFRRLAPCCRPHGRSLLQHYILVDRKPVKASLREWAIWFEKLENRRVAETTIGNLWVSTICFGRCSEKGPPLIFETVVFAEPREDAAAGEIREQLELRRTATWDEAVLEHERVCARVREALRKE
jgi:hypothetical protein